MRNLSINLLASCLAVLLVSSFACVRASFPPIPVVTGGAGAGGAGGSGGQIAGSGGGADAADSGLGPDVSVTCPGTPVPLCTPTTTDPCDPVCQTGSRCDWCSQKCTYAPFGTTAQATCAAKDPNPVAVFQPCGVNYSGLPTQDDNCAPGSICLQPINGNSPSTGYCFALCHNAVQDCKGVACTQRMLSASGGTVAVCEPSYDQCGLDGNCCDPLAPQPGSCGSGRFCLLVAPDQSSGHSRTVCEFSSGNGKNGAACASAHDCSQAYTCVNDGPHNGCHRVCNTANPCPVGGGECLPWGTEYSFCSTS
jgi:hypothetical protein